jgi:WD40 repeat protein
MQVWCCAFDSSGLLLASGGSDNVVRVWRVADGSVLSVLSGHKVLNLLALLVQKVLALLVRKGG